MTGIEWTDYSANAWAGCTRIKAVAGARSGCEICYAASFCGCRMGMEWGPGTPRRQVKGFRAKMLRLHRLGQRLGIRFSVFLFSLADVLDPEVDPAWRAEAIDIIEQCDQLDILLLTHRPHLAQKLLPSAWRGSAPAHLYPGVTVDHPLHGFRWRQHLDFWGAGRAWVSAEPLTAALVPAVDLSHAAVTVYGGASGVDDPVWRFDSRWVEVHIDKHGPERVFFKQYGAFGPDGQRVGKRAAGRYLRGQLFDFTPWALNRALLTAAKEKNRPAPSIDA